MSNRRDARERTMQALYAYEVSGSDPAHIIDHILKPELAEEESDLRFAESLFLGAIDAHERADSIIKEHVQNWDFGRIALIDRILLRMAITELLHFEDIPPKVSINEAIEIAKKYSTPKSGQFVNGILDAVLVQLQQENRLHKTGRGLLGMSLDAVQPEP